MQCTTEPNTISELCTIITVIKLNNKRIVDSNDEYTSTSEWRNVSLFFLDIIHI